MLCRKVVKLDIKAMKLFVISLNKTTYVKPEKNLFLINVEIESISNFTKPFQFKTLVLVLV